VKEDWVCGMFFSECEVVEKREIKWGFKKKCILTIFNIVRFIYISVVIPFIFKRTYFNIFKISITFIYIFIIILITFK